MQSLRQITIIIIMQRKGHPLHIVIGDFNLKVGLNLIMS